MSYLRMVVGLQITGDRNVEVHPDGDFGTSTMRIHPRGGTPWSVELDQGVWRPSLGTGEYIFTIEVDTLEQWTGGTITFGVKPAPSEQTRFVSYEAPDGTTPGVIAWNALEAVSEAGNPKNPWPPPIENAAFPATLSRVAKIWFDEELAGHRQRTEREKPDVKTRTIPGPMPARVTWPVSPSPGG